MTDLPDLTPDAADAAPGLDPIDMLLAHGTATTETVNLYSDQALMAEIEEFYARRDRALNEAQIADDMAAAMLAMGEARPATVEQIEAEFDREEAELLARYEASQIKVTVRALEQDEIDSIREMFPMPDAPPMLARSASQKLKDLWAKQRDEFRRKAEEVERLQDAHMVATAVIEFRSGETVRESITPEEVLRIRRAAFGAQRIGRILDAIKRCSTERTEVPRPK